MSNPPDAPAGPPTRVGVGLVRRDHRFLVRRRPEGAALAGLWEFPGGKCEPGEPPDDTTRRECREELGIDVEVVSLRRVAHFRYPHARLELYYYDCVTCDPSDQPRLATGFRWVASSELRSLEFPEANGPIVADLAREYPGPVTRDGDRS
jgi:mutator protein MutT